MNRNQALLAWTQSVLEDDDCYLKPASNDASFRNYWRVFSKSDTYIVMDAPPKHENCLPFIEISKRLNQINIHAPKVLKLNLEMGFLLLDDLGNNQYLTSLNNDTATSLYKDAINAIHHYQTNINTENLPIYTKQLLSSELNLFCDWFITKHIGFDLSENHLTLLEEVFNLLINNAIEQPQVFVHRDYHSRNLMQMTENNPGILDFQDAVIGPVTYDLVSLLKDCYISWDETYINKLSNKFRKKHNILNQSRIKTKQWQKWFDLMGLQRHLKAIGIFCRLNYRDNKPNYLKDINRTMNYVKQTCLKYEELNSFLLLLEQINPCMENLCEP